MQFIPYNRMIATLLSTSALALGLTACDRGDSSTVGQKLDSAVQQSETAVNDAKQATQQAADTAGQKIDDMSITAKVSAGLAKDPDLSAVKIDVDTRNGTVTLTGPVDTAQAKERATVIAQSVEGVAAVHNNLTVKAG
ncbi:BON domain-containing protein [Ramlibacter sp. H39-3-26]|uniref:BON domain-containing protein n=1 Tax=Curvibacter soli TaxID=3031331 RepID=UPI0023DA6FC8|nr:BON domain-containing protein [Ramlibacter sp. H39-3-26]MDF1485993.1 BON domain-containing protein [Ramlibacter sp. H39-3-26]